MDAYTGRLGQIWVGILLGGVVVFGGCNLSDPLEGRDTGTSGGEDTERAPDTREKRDTNGTRDADGRDVRDTSVADASDATWDRDAVDTRADAVDAADAADINPDTADASDAPEEDTLDGSDSAPTDVSDAEDTSQIDTAEPTDTSVADGSPDSQDTSGDVEVGDGTPGEACSSDLDCDNGACVSDGSTQVCAHTIFTTSTTQDGNRGGLLAMDTECLGRAVAGGLSGTWQTVASDSTTDASARLTIAAPVYDTNGDRVADGAAEFWSGSLQNPPNHDEFGTTLTGSSVGVWTGTSSSGSATGTDCSGWTTSLPNDDGDFGDATSTSTTWLNSSSSDCRTSNHIYCIDQ